MILWHSWGLFKKRYQNVIKNKDKFKHRKKELFQPKDISESREAPEMRQREARTNSEGPRNVFSEM